MVWWVVGAESLAKGFREREGLTGHQFLEGGCWERGGDFFRDRGGAAIFTSEVNLNL